MLPLFMDHVVKGKCILYRETGGNLDLQDDFRAYIGLYGTGIL